MVYFIEYEVVFNYIKLYKKKITILYLITNNCFSTNVSISVLTAKVIFLLVVFKKVQFKIQNEIIVGKMINLITW